MRIVILSDTHQKALPRTPLKGDLLIHAGDFYDVTDQSDRDLVHLNRWFAKQNFEEKVFVPGNHDYPVFRSWHKGEEKLTEAKLLVDESITYNGLNIYGSPWEPNCGMAFDIQEENIADKWIAIPDQTNILITHIPPFCVLDCSNRFGNIGCPSLFDRVFEVTPKLHAFGHVHACRGWARIGPTIFANASQTHNNTKREPIIVNI